MLFAFEIDHSVAEHWSSVINLQRVIDTSPRNSDIISLTDKTIDVKNVPEKKIKKTLKNVKKWQE